MAMGSLYCTPADLLNVINPLALTGITMSQQQAACVSASDEADSYLNGRYNLPLASWDGTLTRHVAYIAVYQLLAARGYNPSAGGDTQIQENYWRAVGHPQYPGTGYFPGIQRQTIHPTVKESTPAIGSPAQLPQVITSQPRGWYGGRLDNGGIG